MIDDANNNKIIIVMSQLKLQQNINGLHAIVEKR